MKKIAAVLLVLMVTLSLSSCSDKEDDEEIYRGDQDTKITQPPKTTPTTKPAPAYPNVSGHGILWKPVADSGGKLVVLLNRSYGRPAVKVKNRNNQLIATGIFIYFSNPDRATYRFAMSGPEMARRYGTVYLIVGSKIFTVPNPATRYE